MIRKLIGQMRRAVLAALLICVAACSKPDRIVVLYRGGASIDVKAPVTRAGQPLGFVAEVHRSAGLQRVVIAVRKGGELRRGDRFFPFRATQGIGFKVLAGTGEPLRNGDEIEAWPLRSEAPLQPTAPAESLPEIRSPGDRAEPTLPPALRIRNEDYPDVPPKLRSRIQALPETVRDMEPTEAAMFLTGQRHALTQELLDARDKAIREGNQAAVRQLNKLRKQTERLIRVLQATLPASQ